MRPVLICACLYACAAVSLAASEPSPVSSDLTVIVDFKGPFTSPSMVEMRREAARIIAASGVSVDWRQREGAAAATYNDIVVMTFKGSCTFSPAPPVYDELGPYATTKTANGEVQPFGEVDCDRVVNSVRSAMFGNDYANADLLVGRALGRVVAHELVHMLTKSGQHAHEGVQRAALSGRQLIASSLPLSAFDIDRLKLERKRQ